MDKFLVAIPVYNEESNLQKVLFDISRIIDRSDTLVVNDGSTDCSLEIIANSLVPFITHPFRKGKGAALLTAFRYALRKNYQWIICMDGDGQHKASDIQKFINIGMRGNTDLIIGKRINRAGKMPFSRQMSNGITSIILSLCIGNSRIRDSQSGFRALRTRCIPVENLKCSGFQLESEIILRMCKAGRKVTEIPIQTFYSDEKSSIRPFADTCKFVGLIINSFFWQ